MKVAVCYNQPEKNQPDVMDVLDETDVVVKALTSYHHEHQLFALSLGQRGMDKDLARLIRFQPDVVFNLLESHGHDPRIQSAAAGLWAVLGIPCTGCHYAAMLTTTDKLLAKALMEKHRLPTPAWEVYRGGPLELEIPGPWIVKPAWEDASVGIHDNIYFTAPDKLRQEIRRLLAFYRQPLLVETFINGREFNVALVEQEQEGVEVLPPAEIVFDQWPQGKPKILTYQAKWMNTSAAYQQTRRQFVEEESLAQSLKQTALQCWQTFGLNGYARVDFREDQDGRLWVLEINANPGIASDSGFMAAADRAGYPSAQIIQRLLDVALKPKGAFQHGPQSN